MKILYVTTISNTINAFLIPHIELLINDGHIVDVAFNIEQEVKSEINELGCKIYEVPFDRNPLSYGNIRAIKRLRSIIESEKYDIVHTHTPIASAIARMVCKNFKNIKVLYTAHGFHFYKGAPIFNWLFYYPIEKWMARYTDVILTINKEDHKRAVNKFKAKKIEYVPGVGLELNKFKNNNVDKIEYRSKLGIPIEAILLLSVGELNENKNHEVVIRALAMLNNKQVHYAICGIGYKETYLKQLVIDLNIETNVHFMGYRKDITEVCSTADIFVFPSYREGLSVALMEAMAVGMPIVCSNIRGNSDLIQNKQGGILVEVKKGPLEFSRALDLLICNESLRKAYGEFNKKQIENYSLTTILSKIKNIYNEVVEGGDRYN